MGSILNGLGIDSTFTVFVFKFFSLITALIGLLICLMGRKIVKPIISILCMLNGLFLGAIFCAVLNISNNILVVFFSVAFMLLGLILSINYQKLMTNITLSWFIGGIIFSLFVIFSKENAAISILLGLLMGLLAFIALLVLFKHYYDNMVIITMALIGSVLFSYFIFIMFKYKGFFDYLGSLALFGATNVYNNSVFGKFYQVEGVHESNVWILIAIALFIGSLYFQIKKAKKEDIKEPETQISLSNQRLAKKLKSIRQTTTQTTTHIAAHTATQTTEQTTKRTTTHKANSHIRKTASSLDMNSKIIIGAGILLALISLFFKTSILLKITSIAFSISLVILLIESSGIRIKSSIKDACLILIVLCGAIGIIYILFTTGIIYYILEYGLAAACVYGLYKKQEKASDGEFILSITGIAAAINFLFLLIIYTRVSFIMLAVLCICLLDSYRLIIKKQTAGMHIKGKHQA